MTEQIVVQGDPKTFDLEGFLNGFEPVTQKAKLHKRADLLPRIFELQELAEAWIEKDVERSVAEEAEYGKIVFEHNELVAIFEDPANIEVFEFKPISHLGVTEAIRKAVEDGYKIETDSEAISCYQMAEVCISHPGITGSAFIELRKKVGDLAAAGLIRAWAESIKTGADQVVPFSPLS